MQFSLFHPSIRNYPLFFLMVLMVLGGCKQESSESAEQNVELAKSAPYKIAVIPKGTTHEFWKSIHAGAAKAAQELGNVEIDWKGPQKEDDREAQITVVEDFIAKQVDGIVLAPLDNVALVRPVMDASRNGIPVVIIDSDLEGEAHRSFVATDNYQGGVIAARHMGEITGGEGKLIVMRYQEGSASTMKREKGFLETIKEEFPNIEILSENQYAGSTAESALQKSETLLLRYPQVSAVYTPNESSTFGMLKALQDIDKADKVDFIGFDASPALVDALENGEIDALVVQNPLKMGYLGVKTLVSILEGESVKKEIDTGVELVTNENMNDSAISQLLNPPLEKYLGSGS